MLKDLDVSKYPKMYLICGYTDLRMGMKRLVQTIRFKYAIDPYDTESIFLFCGRRADTIKALHFEGDGMVVLTKKLSDGRYMWPRTTEEVRALTKEQFKLLINGFTFESTIRINGKIAI